MASEHLEFLGVDIAAEPRRKSRESLFSQTLNFCPFCFLLFKLVYPCKLSNQQNEVIAVAEVALTLFDFFLTSIAVCDFVFHYLPSHLYPAKFHSHPIPHSQRHSERRYNKERRCCVHWDSATAFCFSNIYVRIPSVESTWIGTISSDKSRSYNNTYLNDGVVPGCVNTSVLQCSNQYGGLFDEGTSTTWSPGNFTAIGTAGEYGSDQDSDTWGDDTLLINTTLSVPDFPLGIFRGSTTDQENTLGLGRNSTLLSALVSAGTIATRTFSLFQGWTGAQAQYQTDGSLILGGYDSAKITGNNVTLPFAVDDSCIGGLVISVTDINMNLRNGSNISIIGKSQGSAMRACIEPSYSPITLSDEIWWAFTNVTGVAEIGRSVSQVSNFWGMMIPANGA